MSFFEIDLEDIQLFSCAVVGKEIQFNEKGITSIMFPCYNAGYWQNVVNPIDIPTFIDRSYIILFDVANYDLKLTKYDSFIDPKDVIFKGKLSNKFRDINKLDDQFYIESLTYRDGALGHIWGPISSRKCLVALPNVHKKLYRDDSLIKTYKTKIQELNFINGEEINLETFCKDFYSFIRKQSYN